MSATRWLDEREDRAWRDYLQMNRRLTAHLNRRLQEHAGISGADYEVLVNLSEAPDERLRAFELCEAMDWEKSRLSHQLTRMEKRGLVQREECTTDGRGAHVVLTAEGRDLIERVAPAHVEDVRRSFVDVLTERQLATLTTIAGRVVERLAEDDDLE